MPVASYRDSFGNWCNRLVAPAGHFSLGTDAIIRDSGLPDPIELDAQQHQVRDLPSNVSLFLLGSRYCETDRLADETWRLFGNTPPGWPRVQAICDFVQNHITFGYEHSRATRTACETYAERSGVCRDYAHLAITFCRCLNIPARYCTGYLTDVGLPPPYPPMDFAAWIEVYLGGRLAHVRSAQQRAAHRPCPHRAGPRRRRRAADPYLWPGESYWSFASGHEATLMHRRRLVERTGRAAFGNLARDYFRVEDKSGLRFWLFRSGLYRDLGTGAAPPGLVPARDVCVN